MLDDVRQRLLDDPVERRLDLARQPLVAELRLEVDAHAGLLAERVARAARAPARARSRRAPTGAARPRAGARPGASRRRARARDATAARASSVAALCSSGFRPSRIDVSAWPVSSCSSRASRARSSSCASTTRRTASRLTRSERSTATAARAASASASRRSSSVKRGRRRRPCRGRSTTPIAPAARDERHVERRVDAEPPRGLLVDLRIVEHRVDALAPTALEHAARLRAAELELASRRPRTCRLAVGGRDAQRRRRPGSAIRTSRASTSSRSRRATSASSGSSSSSEASALPISFSDSSWRSQRVDDLVQPRVLDRDRRLRGEQLRQLLVLLGEVVAALPSRSGRGSRRRRRAAGSARRGTSSSAGGRGGKPTERGSSAMSCSRSGCASRGSGRRGCRGRAAGRRSPACVSASMPVVRNRSSACPDLSITPSAA